MKSFKRFGGIVLMKQLLQESYQNMVKKYEFTDLQFSTNINMIIREALNSFIKNCENAAIWCYGIHTKVLMADFMNELKDIKYIIDKTHANSAESGFKIILEEQISKEKIDGIIISTYKYKDEIIEILNNEYSGIKYLDLYQALQEQGICLNESYYFHNHPYYKYRKIHEIQKNFNNPLLCDKQEEYCKRLIGEYVNIKDFSSAITCARWLNQEYPKKINEDLLQDLYNIYMLEKNAAGSIEADNLIMLCFDGVRRKDLCNGLMPNLNLLITDKMHFYKNAYSSSTSTYESLIPAYSENNDLRTKYYNDIPIAEEKCRFICEAIKQKRNIFFYTDSGDYIDSKSIVYNYNFQTATEKIWDFVMDAVDEKNGLFYIHILYESHFSYPNPYTLNDLVTDGTNVFFDYLDRNGGKLRTDYEKQHQDALRYLDDVIPDFLNQLKCRMVIYADHGNIIPEKETDIKDIDETMYTFHEDLIRIPLAIKSPETGIGQTEKLESLMSLNSMIVSLMQGKCYHSEPHSFVKIQRSALYNPDFQFIYRKYGQEHGLLAFEAFVFENNYKLVIFSDGITELFSIEDEKKVNGKLKEELFSQIKDFVTVCELENVKL